jgi:hypothetical protein
MTALDGVLLPLLLVIVAVWTALAIAVTVSRFRFHRRAHVLAMAGRALQTEGLHTRPPQERARRVRELLERLTPFSLYLQLADRTLSPVLAETIAAHLTDRLGLSLILRDAQRAPVFQSWRRVSALAVLSYIRHHSLHTELRRAMREDDPVLAQAAAAILGRVGDVRAAEILLDALRDGPIAPGRVAAELDQFPVAIDHLIRPLLEDRRSHARYWAASLLGRYRVTGEAIGRLQALTDDPHPGTRKAAIRSLGESGDPAAVPVALRLLEDPTPFVRTQAIRSLLALGIAVEAPESRRAYAVRLGPLLGDPVWEVRYAAREALVALGPAVWREVGAQLDAADAFARNGAAEVLQNLGLLDTMIDLIAGEVEPSPEGMALLERAFREGGPALVDAAVARANPERYPMVLGLLTRLGFQQAAVAD